MESGLRGKRVAVTGAASGIGRATVGLLTAEGADVVAVDRDADGLARLRADHREIVGVVADLSTVDGVADAVRLILDGHERVDVLVNNAGIGFVGDTLATTAEQWDLTFAVNVRATFLLCQALIPTMVAQGGGVIVNVSSAAALAAVANRAAYTASKGAIIAYTRSLTVDHGADGIRANAVAPGTVDTPWIARMTGAQNDPAAAREAMTQRQLIGRLGQDTEIAEAILHLASDRSSFQHGSTLVVDGGFSAR